jgi:hypothetical protein
MNVVEQLLWLSTNGTVDVENLPVTMRGATNVMVPVPDRRRQVADDLYDALKGGASVLGARLSDVPESRYHPS